MACILNPLDPSLLWIAVSPPWPPEAVGHIADIIIGQIQLNVNISKGLHNYRIHKVILH